MRAFPFSWRRWLAAWLALGAIVAPGQELPPLPPAPADAPLSQQPSLFIKAFAFEGNQVIDSAELARLLEPYTNRLVTAEELEQARVAVTQHYISRGYINSGAVLPDQNIDDGVVRLRVVEGRLTAVHVRGNKHLGSDYVKPRIELGSGPPLNIVHLRDQLELLRQHPAVAQINAELKPGAAPGEAELDLVLREANPLQVGLEFSNNRPPSTGAERFTLLAWHNSLTGRGDVLNLRYGITTDGLEDIQLAGLDDISAYYALPVTVHDTLLQLGYARSNASIIEEPFDELDIESELESFSVGLRQPVYRTPSRELALSLSGEYQENHTSQDGDSSQLSPGADLEGQTRVTTIRFSQEWLDRDERSALALRSSFNFGVNVLSPTINGRPEPDSEFFSWLGQGQYVHRLWQTQNLLVLRGAMQLADQRLLPLEQLSLGGMETIRGYRENQVIRDNGALGSVEVRVPLVFDVQGRPIFQLAPFIDSGIGWDHDDSENALNLASAGLGLLFNPDRRLAVTVYWGYPFRDFDDSEDNAQDAGFHFNVTVLAF